VIFLLYASTCHPQIKYQGDGKIGRGGCHQVALTGQVMIVDFNDGSGSVVSDKSGYGNQGRLTGATWVGGDSAAYGMALYFDGVDDSVSMALSDTLEFDTSASFSVSIMTYVNTFAGSWDMPLEKGSGYPASGWDYEWGATSQTSVISDKFSDTTVTFVSQPVLGQWVSGVLVINRTTQLAIPYFNYVQGTARSIRGLGSMVNATRPLAFSLPSYHYKGVLDDVRVYARALTPLDMDNERMNRKRHLCYTK